MKKLLLACACLPLFLAACSGPLDITLSGMGDPEKARLVLETMTPEERSLMSSYIINHTMAQDLDDKVTVKQAIAARRKEIERDKEKIQG